MGFHSEKKFVPSTKQEVKDYAIRGKKKEEDRKEKTKFKLESLEKRFRIQIEKCAEGNPTLRRLLDNRPSKTVQKNGRAFLVQYFKLLAEKRTRQRAAVKADPKATFLWEVKVPKLDLSQPGQFVYEVRGLWCLFNWDDLNQLLEIVIGKKHGLPERSTVEELVRRAMRQVLGVSESRKGLGLSSPDTTLQLWEPLRKKYMGKKQKLIEAIEAIDETPVKKKKKKVSEEGAVDFASKKTKKLKSKGTDVLEASEKPKKKEKLNGHDESESKRLPNLKDDSVLKTKGKHEYRKGMGQVWSLLTKEGITAKKFFGLAAKKKMDPVRTRIYLATMRRAGSVTVS